MTFDWRAHFAGDSALEQVQSRLNALGASPPLTVDGVMGPKTLAAIKAFQASHNLAVDGVVGPQTLAALGLTSLQPLPKKTDIAPELLSQFPAFTQQFEGYKTYMYTDHKGYVTTGVGNLIDPIGAALALPWKKPDGSLASQAEISAAWWAVKGAFPAIQSTAAQSLTNLRLTRDDVDKIVQGKVRANHVELLKQYPGYTLWPIPAQIVLHSISWAWGAYFANTWDHVLGGLGSLFKQAVNAPKPDFLRAAGIAAQAGAYEAPKNPGIVPRNAANDALLAEAATMVKAGLGAGLVAAVAFGLWFLWKRGMFA